MAPVDPVAAVGGVANVVGQVAGAPAHTVGTMSFTDLVTSGLRAVDAKIARADALIEAYAVGDPVPVHQVTLAIGEARMAVEMATQIRSKLVDTYHDFLNMQL